MKTNKYFVFTLLLTSLVLGSCAQKTTQTAINNSNTTIENSLLWEISGKDVKTPSYLYGTIHLISEKDFFITPETQKALDKADRYTFEIDTKSMNDMGAMMGLMEKAMMNDDITLADLLSKEDYKLVDSFFNAKGLPLMLLERMKPMFLSMFTSMDMDMSSGLKGSSDTKSYELEFTEMAEKNKKEIAGLETAEYQMSMFDSIPYKAQAEMLVAGIKEGSSGEVKAKDQMKKMVDAYKKQDLKALGDMLNGDDLGNYTELLLVNRNKNWIPVMQKMMREKCNLFAVGAGHLAGENGVVNLLRKAGYTVKPLNK